MAGGYYHKNSVLGVERDLHQLYHDGGKFVCHEEISIDINEHVRDVLHRVIYLGISGEPTTDFDPKSIHSSEKLVMEEASGYEFVTLHDTEKIHQMMDGVYSSRIIAKLMSIGVVATTVRYMLYPVMLAWCLYNICWNRTNILDKY
jgi:hypothetical protein